MARGTALVVAAYLLGSLSFSYLVVRIVAGKDLRRLGSGNAGATNALRVAGRAPALLSLGLDAGKGAAAAAAGLWFEASPALLGGMAVAVVAGHVFPVFFGLRGGRGVATAAGAMAVLAPVALLFAAAIFVAVVAASRFVSLGSVAATLAFPLLLLAGLPTVPGPEATPALTAAAAGVAVLVVGKHVPNLRRLRRGVEPRFRRAVAGQPPARSFAEPSREAGQVDGAGGENGGGREER